jgi:hypothetical protein
MRNLVTALLIFVPAAFVVWCFGVIVKTGTEESRVRIRHNLDEKFFDYVETKVHSSPGAKERIETMQDKHTTSVETLVDSGAFLRDISKPPHSSSDLFSLRDYFISKLDDNTVMICRQKAPNIPRSMELRDAHTLRYDPTNGIYSEGFHFRIFHLGLSEEVPR